MLRKNQFLLMEQINQLTAANTELQQRLNNLEREYENLRSFHQQVCCELGEKCKVLSEIYSIENVYTGLKISSIRELKDYFGELKCSADYWERSYRNLRADYEEKYTIAPYL